MGRGSTTGQMTAATRQGEPSPLAVEGCVRVGSFTITRTHDPQVRLTKLTAVEDGAPCYEDSDTPKPAFIVDVSFPNPQLGLRSEAAISWPSTSDKRPALARALARALELAAAIAETETGLD